MVSIMKTNRSVTLDNLESVEDTAAHIARSFKAIASIARQQNGLLTWLQSTLEIFILGIAE